MKKIFKKIWEFIKAFFKINSRYIDEFSEDLFNKGMDELIKALKNTLPKTKTELMGVIKRNFVIKFANVPIVNVRIEQLFEIFEDKVKSIKFNQLVQTFGKFAKEWFADLYVPKK